MWLLIVLSLALLFVLLSLRISPQFAIGFVVPLTWLFPAWLLLPLIDGAPGSIVATGIDVKVTTGIACLVLYCFMPKSTFPVRLAPCDFAVASLIGLHVASDTLGEGFNWVILGRAYAEWFVPYVSGRLALQSRLDASRLFWIPSIVGVALSLAAIPEAFTNFHWLEYLFGARPREGFNPDAARWGIQRAYGPTMHPIYFGVVLLLLLGWSVYAASRATRRKAFSLFLFAPIPIIAGIGCTASRGPIIGIAVACIGLAFIKWPKARIPILALAVIGIFSVFAFRESIVSQLENWGSDRQREIVIDGEEQIQSSTRSRLNMMAMYSIALRRSGLFGFGTEACSGFPINVPIGAQELKTLKSVKYIDNTYVLLTLRLGYLGIAAFVASALLAIWQFVWIADRFKEESPQWLSSCVGGTMIGALAVLATVWMPHEIGFLLVWTFGVSSGLFVASSYGNLDAKVRKKRVSNAEVKDTWTELRREFDSK